MSILEWR